MSSYHLLRTSLAGHHALCKTHAERLKKKGDLQLLLEDLGVWNKDREESFHTDRLRMIDLAKTNDMYAASVEAFKALGDNLTHDALAAWEKCHNAGNKLSMKKEDGSDSPYSSISNDMEEELASIMGITTDNKLVKDETKDSIDMEDGLTILENNRPSEHFYRCPLTGDFFKDPVKNAICGHIYSNDAILAHLKISAICPVAGCSNKRVRSVDLISDVEFSQRVRRQRRRQDLEQQQRQRSQSLEEELDNLEEQQEITHKNPSPCKSVESDTCMNDEV